MAALTLVMNELDDLDAEDFLNVRAYHSCGKDFRQYMRQGGAPPSPTDSDSSGVSSLTVSTTPSEDESSSSAVATSSSKTTKSDTKLHATPATPCEVVPEKPQVKNKKEEVDKKDQIYYCGRNILNLERNTQPLKWQLTSPLFGFLNPYVFVNYRSYFRYEGESLLEEYPMKTCEKCEFRVPFPYF